MLDRGNLIFIGSQLDISRPNWYRVYSDGWIEQGGLASVGTSGVTKLNINFHKQFNTSNINVVATLTADTVTSDRCWCISRTFTKTYFTWIVAPASTADISWMACGY